MKEIFIFEDWFCFCFEWGFIIDIILSDLEIWIVILCKKVKVDGLVILNEVMFYIVN